MLRLGQCRDGRLPWAVQRWATSWEKGHWAEKAPGCLGLGRPGMGDLLGGKKRILVPIDHLFHVIFLPC